MIVIPKAILFDLDDTLISLSGAAQKAFEHVCRSFLQERQMPFDYNALIKSVKEVMDWFWGDPERHRTGRLDLDNTRRKIFLQAFSSLNCNDAAEAHGLADAYGKCQEDMTCLFPNTVATLEALQKAGMKMGLITNGSVRKQRAKIERFSLEKYFAFCLIEEEAGFGKPDLRVYEKALELLNMDASDVWMVGDNLIWDIEAPQKLGIYAVWVDMGNRTYFTAPDVVPDKTIKDISELLHLIPEY
ncbi:MAG: HAD family hydrolase [Bacillota bacterium]